MLYPNDADGNAIRHSLIPDLEKAGFTVVDPGGYEDGTSDFAAQIARFKAGSSASFSTRFRSRRTLRPSGGKRRNKVTPRPSRSRNLRRRDSFPATSRRSERLATNFRRHSTGIVDFPYKSALTDVSGHELADGYERASGKQWESQLGASMALLDAGVAAIKASGNPKSKAAIAKALSTLKTTVMTGKIDFTSGPVPNVSTTNLVGVQWIKSKAGSKYAFRSGGYQQRDRPSRARRREVAPIQ